MRCVSPCGGRMRLSEMRIVVNGVVALRKCQRCGRVATIDHEKVTWSPPPVSRQRRGRKVR